MSRPINDGLLYFPFDCDFFANKTTKIIRAHYGAEGILMYLYILCDIYKNGYFTKVDNDYIDIISTDLGIAENTITEILKFLTERSVFDLSIYEKDGVLTSKDIQLCFQEAIKARAKRKPRIIENYWLLAVSETAEHIKQKNKSENNPLTNGDKSEINPHTEDSYSEIYDTNKRKENKSKEKEIKEKQIKENKTSDGLGLVVDFYKKYFGDIKQEETDRLAELLEKYEDKLIMECILIAAQKGVKKLSYIIGILKNLDKSGISTLEQYERSKRNDTFTGANEKHNEQHTEEYGTTV